MNSLFADTALLPGGWANHVRLELSRGRIAKITADAPRSPATSATRSCPGMPNLHSHAFQRGMAGLAETRGPGPTASGRGAR